MSKKKKWCLTHPRPIHFKLAELTAQGLNRQEAARETGLSVWQISRIRHSPLFAEMVTQARVQLAEAEARSRRDPAGVLNQEAVKSTRFLAAVRDFSGSEIRQLSAASTLLKLWEKHCLPPAPPQPKEKEAVHILLVETPSWSGPGSPSD